MTDPLHVAPGIVGILDAPNHVRIRAIRTERWIGSGRARRVVEHLSALCEYPPSTRPPGLARRIQVVVATRSLSADRRNRSSASAGVFQSSVFRGRELRAAATAAISSALCMLRSVPLGKY